MQSEGIPSGLQRLTKTQKTRIGKLGSEWTILDSAENLISKLIFEGYRALPPDAKRTSELAELEHQQKEIFERKREITADVISLQSGDLPLKRPAREKDRDPFILVRDIIIRQMKDQSNDAICRKLDFELKRGEMTFGFPESWTKQFDVKSFGPAYRHPGCKNRVQKMFSVAKRGLSLPFYLV